MRTSARSPKHDPCAARPRRAAITVTLRRIPGLAMADGQGSLQARGAPFVLGLTGSVGMGKSTVARMFQAQGVPVLDADQVVHQLYAPGGAAVPAVQRLFPAAVDSAAGGGVDRAALGRAVLGKPDAMAALEAAVHPLVAEARAAFLAQHEAQGTPLVVLDIPLLYEKRLEAEVDAVAVVSASPEQQRARVLARGWTEAKFESVVALQVPDAEKRARADFVIDTSTNMEATRSAVTALVGQLRGTQQQRLPRPLELNVSPPAPASP